MKTRKLTGTYGQNDINLFLSRRSERGNRGLATPKTEKSKDYQINTQQVVYAAILLYREKTVVSRKLILIELSQKLICVTVRSLHW